VKLTNYFQLVPRSRVKVLYIYGGGGVDLRGEVINPLSTETFSLVLLLLLLLLFAAEHKQLQTMFLHRMKEGFKSSNIFHRGQYDFQGLKKHKTLGPSTYVPHFLTSRTLKRLRCAVATVEGQRAPSKNMRTETENIVEETSV
jgi:hypothetical protein